MGQAACAEECGYSGSILLIVWWDGYRARFLLRDRSTTSDRNLHNNLLYTVTETNWRLLQRTLLHPYSQLLEHQLNTEASAVIGNPCSATHFLTSLSSRQERISEGYDDTSEFSRVLCICFHQSNLTYGIYMSSSQALDSWPGTQHSVPAASL